MCSRLITLQAIGTFPEGLLYHGAVTSNLKKHNFADVEEQGFMPVYERQKITDGLHEACGFRTDYEFITKRRMKGIRKKSKRR